MTTDVEAFHDSLVRHHLIIPTGVQGVFGRGSRFEEVVARVDQLVSRVSRDDDSEVCMFPPVISRNIIERVSYMDSFPHLCGAVCSFFGNDTEAISLSGRIHRGERWDDLLGMTDLVLNPAACYPVYPGLSGTAPQGGRRITTLNWVFRHEPSPEPTRMQAFRLREFVRVGVTDEVLEWRDIWIKRAVRLLQSMDLPVTIQLASDPFFGRAGEFLAANQQEQELKYEALTPVCSIEKPTAMCSFNFHRDHFSSEFDIRTHDGNTAATGCVGFGLERIVMALFKTHGFEFSCWPRGVRSFLWP